MGEEDREHIRLDFRSLRLLTNSISSSSSSSSSSPSSSPSFSHFLLNANHISLFTSLPSFPSLPPILFLPSLHGEVSLKWHQQDPHATYRTYPHPSPLPPVSSRPPSVIGGKEREGGEKGALPYAGFRSQGLSISLQGEACPSYLPPSSSPFSPERMTRTREGGREGETVIQFYGLALPPFVAWSRRLFLALSHPFRGGGRGSKGEGAGGAGEGGREEGGKGKRKHLSKALHRFCSIVRKVHVREIGIQGGLRMRLLESFPSDEEGRGVEIKVRERVVMKMCTEKEEGEGKKNGSRSCCFP